MRPPPIETREICDDTVTVGAEGADWDREEYTAENGEKRIRMTRRK